MEREEAIAKQRKRQSRFSVDDDEALTKEALVENPFEAPLGQVGAVWARVTIGVSPMVDGRRCRGRIGILFGKLPKKTRQQLLVSGVEGEVTQIDHDLQHLCDLIDAQSAEAEKRADDIRLLPMQGRRTPGGEPRKK